jgi:hypothetical protein
MLGHDGGGVCRRRLRGFRSLHLLRGLQQQHLLLLKVQSGGWVFSPSVGVMMMF